MKEGDKPGLDRILKEIKEGSSPAQISDRYNIPKQTMSDRLTKLKKMGCVRKVGYGTWKVIGDIKEVREVPKGSIRGEPDFSKKEIRGHAFIWKIEFIKPYEWNKIIRSYRKKKLTFNLIGGVAKFQRTIFKSRKIWFTKKGLTIYEPLDFLGKSSFSVKGTAVFEMDRLIKDLLMEMNQKFRQYRFSTSREHYGMIKNELARQYNDRKEKMIVRAEDGTAWLWIDDSKGLGELETGEPNVSRQVQNYWNSHKKHDFKVDADFVTKNFQESAKQIKQNAKNLDYHADNMRSHVEAVRKLGDGVEKNNQIMEKILEVLENK